MAKTPHNLAELHYCAQERPFYRTAVHNLVNSAMAQWKVQYTHIEEQQRRVQDRLAAREATRDGGTEP